MSSADRRARLAAGCRAEAIGHAVGARAVYLRLRHAGRHRRAAWLAGEAIGAALPEWVDAALERQDATLELTRVDNAGETLYPGHRLLADRERGLWAFLADAVEPARWIAPNDIVTGNRSHPRALARLTEATGIPLAAVTAHPTRQWLLAHAPRPQWQRLYRQKAPPGARKADRAGVDRLRRGLAEWLCAQAAESGRLPYKYWPGNGRYSPADNSIRRLFGVFALRQHAWSRGDGEQRALADRCLSVLLDERYLDADGCGLVTDRNGVKLGAVAVAGLALLAAPSVPDPGLVPALYRTTRRLWRDDGRFRTFWWPAMRDDNQNFYPGEALLFWARLFRRTGDPALRRDIDRALGYYQRWHRAQRNPAFVPWHSLALATMYETTGNRGYLGDLADMNAWLLSMQQWDDAPSDDMRGRFYAPTRPDFGPPHASSTAVYCEGLAVAAAALRHGGDASTACRFTRAAHRGLMNLRQLQYLDVSDLFRFAHPTRVAGALRTEVYDLTVRVDSVAHALQACLAWDVTGLDSLLDDHRSDT
jgi:hypothetical protein